MSTNVTLKVIVFDTRSEEVAKDSNVEKVNLEYKDGNVTLKVKKNGDWSDSLYNGPFREVQIESNGNDQLIDKVIVFDTRSEKLAKDSNVEKVNLEYKDGNVTLKVKKNGDWSDSLYNGPFREVQIEGEDIDHPGPIIDQDTGVILLYEKLGRSYRVEADLEDSDSLRWNFPGDVEGRVDIGCYCSIRYNGDEDDYPDEVSFKIFGGKHNDDDPKLARCYDLGITFDGEEARVRTEHEHNEDGGGPYVEHDNERINEGNLERRVIGYRTIAYNFNDGNRLKTKFELYLDKEGLKDNKPANKWKKVAEFIDDGTWINKVRQIYRRERIDANFDHGPPYGPYPYGNSAQQTIRIDNADVDMKVMWCFQISHKKPLKIN